MRPGTAFRSRLSTLLLLLTICCLLGALWNPRLSLGQGPVDFLLLMDESDSVDPAANDRLWQAFGDWSRALPERSRVSLVRFAGSAKTEVPWRRLGPGSDDPPPAGTGTPRRRWLDRQSTDIRLALVTAARQIPADRRAILLLSSDGEDNVNPPRADFPLPSMPRVGLYYLRPPGGAARSHPKLESVNLPETIASGLSLPVSLSLEADGDAEGRIQIRINGVVALDRSVSLAGGDRRVLHFDLAGDFQPVNRLDIAVLDRTANPVERMTRRVTLLADRRLLYIGNIPRFAGSTAARRAGWQITGLPPGRLPHDRAFFAGFDCILLDDVGMDELDPSVVGELLRAVERNGTGLIVAGGPNSFASGAYRHSVLESALPVLAESARPVAGAAVVFVLDKSGSMEVVGRRQSRLADALAAVRDSAGLLYPGDESALLLFDRDAELVAPLQKRIDHARELLQSRPMRPSGGTRLAPALHRAIDLLAGSESAQRFLVLVSDGLVDGADIDALRRRLRDAGIRAIVLLIGADAEASVLHRLSAASDGAVLAIDDSAALPKLMRRELEASRPGRHRGSVVPVTRQPLPFADASPIRWAGIDGYQVTRAREAARVFVATADNDPLLALGQFGAGRVAALPGGMLATQDRQSLLPALLQWIGNRPYSPNLQTSHQYRSGRLVLRADAVDPHNGWHAAPDARVSLVSAAGISITEPLRRVAPGRFEASIEAAAGARYDAVFQIGNERARHAVDPALDREQRRHQAAPWLMLALEEGLIQPWDDTSLQAALQSSTRRVALRPALQAAALALFLLLLMSERLPRPAWTTLIAERFRRGGIPG